MSGSRSGLGSAEHPQQGRPPPSPGAIQPQQHEFLPQQSNSSALLQTTSRPQSLPDVSSGVASVTSQSAASFQASRSTTPAQEHSQDNEDVVVVHVREGSEYKAMLFLLRSVSRHFKLDDILPDVPDHIAASRYHLLRPPDKSKNGDADGFLLRSTHPSGLLVSRRSVYNQQNKALNTQPLPSRTSAAYHDPDQRGSLALMYGGIVRGQFQDMATLTRSTPSSSAATPPALRTVSPPQLTTAADQQDESAASQEQPHSYVIPHPDMPFGAVVRQSARQIRAWRRLQGLVRLATPPSRSILVPIAMPANPGYLKMAADAVMLFNTKGLSLTPFLEVTCMSAAAAARIQAAFRAHRVRKQLNMPVLLFKTRAARVIQRSWRSYLLRKRCSFLSQLAAQSQVLEGLVLGDQLALTVHAADALRRLLIKRARVFPEHRLDFSFTPQNRMFQVVGMTVARPGLPSWTNATKTVLRPAEVTAQFGSRPLYGQSQMMELLTCGATWKDATGNEINKTTRLPQPSEAAHPDDVLIKIAFVNISEAKARASLLFALTWDPVTMTGVSLVPPHLTAMGQTMPPAASESGASASSGLVMHKWASLNSHLTGSSTHTRAAAESLPSSAVHSLVSNNGLPDWYTPLTLSPRHSLVRFPLCGAVPGSGAASPPGRTSSPSQVLRSQLSSQRQSLPRSRERSVSPGSVTPGGIMGHIKIPKRYHSTMDRSTAAAAATDGEAPGRIWPDAPPSDLQTSQSARQPDRSRSPGSSAGQPQAAEVAGSRKPRGIQEGAVASPRPVAQEFEFRPATAQALLQPHIFPALPLAPDVPEEGLGGRPTTAAAILQSMSDALSAEVVVPALPLQLITSSQEQSSASTTATASPTARADLPSARPPSASEAAAISRRGSLLGSARRNSAGSAGRNSIGSDAGSAGGQRSARASKTGNTDGDTGAPARLDAHHMPPRPPAARTSAMGNKAAAVPDPSDIGPWHAQPGAAEAPLMPVFSGAQPVIHEVPVPVHVTQDAEGIAQVAAAKTQQQQELQQQQQRPGQHQHQHGQQEQQQQPDQQQHGQQEQQQHDEQQQRHQVSSESPAPASSHMSYASSPRSVSALPDTSAAVSPVPLELHATQQQAGQQHRTDPEARDALEGQQQQEPQASEAAGALMKTEHSQQQLYPEHSELKTYVESIRPQPDMQMPYDPTSQPRHVTWLSASVKLDMTNSQSGQQADKLQSGVVEPRAVPWELDPARNAKQRVARAQALQHQLLLSGGPATIASIMPGRHLPGASLLPAQAANLQLSDTVLSPGRAARSRSPPKQRVSDHQQPQSGDQAGLLTICQAPIQDVYMPDLLDEMQTTQAMLQRDQGYATEDLLTRIRDENYVTQRTKCITARGPHVVWVKHYETGHCLAPNYVPLSTQAMTELIAGMRAVYQAAATEQAQAQKQEAKMVANEIALEKQQLQQSVRVTAARQKEVIQTMQRVFKEEWDHAAGNRVVSRAMAVNRQHRKEHERAFAQAFARQMVGLLGRSVHKSQRTILRQQQAEELSQLNAAHRAERAARDESIAANKAGSVAMNMWRAHLVRSTGFSEEVKAYEEAAQAYQHDVVALRRLEGIERRQRVGPPGGVWGSQPKEALRQPLQLSSVVSAAEAKRHRKHKSRKHRPAYACIDEQQPVVQDPGVAVPQPGAPAAPDQTAPHSFLPPIPRPPVGAAADAGGKRQSSSRIRSASHVSNASRPISGTSATWSGSYTGTGSLYTGSEFTDDSEFESDAGGGSRSGISMRVCAQSEGGLDADQLSVRGPGHKDDADSLASSDSYDSEGESWVGCTLPELPYAQGARLLSPGKSRRPAGILV